MSCIHLFKSSAFHISKVSYKVSLDFWHVFTGLNHLLFNILYQILGQSISWFVACIHRVKPSTFHIWYVMVLNSSIYCTKLLKKKWPLGGLNQPPYKQEAFTLTTKLSGWRIQRLNILYQIMGLSVSWIRACIHRVKSSAFHIWWNGSIYCSMLSLSLFFSNAAVVVVVVVVFVFVVAVVAVVVVMNTFVKLLLL